MELAPARPWSDEPEPYDESTLLAVSPLDARTMVETLPLDTRFVLRADITPVQFAFLERNGFLLFAGVARPDEVERVLQEMDRVAAKLTDEGIETVYGVPAWFGEGPDGAPMLQRMGFSSVYSPWLEDFVQDARFEPVRRLIGEDARIGTREKDGVVYNCYVNVPGGMRPDLAWHTDALRDVFYNWKMPGPMLNVGLHFDRISPEEGGLRLLPGTHTQSATSTLFRKIHFVTNDDDPDEVMVQTWPGDLTVHDGRLWHRVKGASRVGAVRRSMYVPYVIDAYQPKNENTATNLYMRIFDRVMHMRGAKGPSRLS